MTRIHTDLSRVPVSVAPSPATSGTTFGITDANDAFMPDIYPHWGIFVPTGAVPTRANSELVKVTGSSSSAGTTTKTIVREQGLPVSTAQSVTTSFDFYDANSAEVALYFGATFNAPRGFLLNGKIVPSVATNDLTVAIKGLDGNDPSATNPVYCRIGDTIRVITSALSVTKNDGTNWFDAGRTGLATKEIDYFVYLGYNATDGVVVGFSRIPYATEYDEFSVTTTHEKYCAISTITNAAAGDDYENIGRFAATLSATAAFTWTVPTFTNKNLIQRPIFHSRWLDFTFTFTSGGGAFTNAPTINVASYQLFGHGQVNIRINYTYHATSGGTGYTLCSRMPFVSSSNYNPLYCMNSGGLMGAAVVTTGGDFYIYKYDETTMIANSRGIDLGGVMRI